MDIFTTTKVIKTSLRCRAWWLSRFRGYGVHSVLQRPRFCAMGRVIYDRTWVLCPLGQPRSGT